MSQPGIFTAFRAVVARDITLAMRRKTDVLNALAFFIIAVTLFPLGVGPEIDTLRAIAPGVIWVAALLAAMMSLGRIFAGDYEDGTLEQMLLGNFPLSIMVTGKVFAHWLLTGVPLVLLSPLLGMQLGLDPESLLVLVYTLLIGTPVLSLLGSIGAALTLGVRGGGVLMALLVLPLYVPILIFGAGAVEALGTPSGVLPYLSIQGAILALSVALTPLATAAALRISME